MNSDRLKGQWLQLKGQAKQKGGKLTDDDLDQIDGESERLIGKIQERYGIARQEAEKQVEEWSE
ncbi:MAG: CsbD family protein [Planctomycetota bacterium]